MGDKREGAERKPVGSRRMPQTRREARNTGLEVSSKAGVGECLVTTQLQGLLTIAGFEGLESWRRDQLSRVLRCTYPATPGPCPGLLEPTPLSTHSQLSTRSSLLTQAGEPPVSPPLQQSPGITPAVLSGDSVPSSSHSKGHPNSTWELSFQPRHPPLPIPLLALSSSRFLGTS